MNKALLEQTDTFTYLGVTLGKRLNWKPQIDLQALRHTQLAGALLKEHRLSQTKPVGPAITIYSGKIRTSILYSAEIWGFENLTPLVIAQNKFMRSLTVLPQSTPLKPLFLDLGCTALEEIARFRPIAYWRRLWTTPELLPYANALKYIREIDLACKIKWLQKIKSTLADMGLSHLWEDPAGNLFHSKNDYKVAYWNMVNLKSMSLVQNNSLTGIFLEHKYETKLEAYWDFITRPCDRKLSPI